MAEKSGGTRKQRRGAAARLALGAAVGALLVALAPSFASDPLATETPAPEAAASPTPTPAPDPTPGPAPPLPTPPPRPTAAPAPAATPKPAVVETPFANHHPTPRPTPVAEEPPPRNLTLDLTRVALELRDEPGSTVTLALGAADAPTTSALRVDGRVYRAGDLQSAFASFLRAARPDAARSTDTLALFRANFALQGLVADKARLDHADQDEEFQRLLEQRVNELLAEHYLRKRVLGDIAVTSAEVEEYYADHPVEFTQPRLLTLRLIVVGSAEEADEARKRLESGIAFEKVAEELSIHASRQKGGLLKPLPRGSLDPRVEAVAWELAPEEVSAPIPVDNLFYIAKSLGATPATVEDLESARPRLLEKLYEAKRRERLRHFAADVLRQRKVVLFEEEAAPTAELVLSPTPAAAESEAASAASPAPSPSETPAP